VEALAADRHLDGDGAVMGRSTQGLLLALGALSLFGLLVAWFGPSEPPRRIPSAPALAEQGATPVVRSASPLSPSGDHPPPRIAKGVEARALAPPEVRLRPLAEEAPGHDAREHPHPITERHRRIQHENNLRALLNEAVTARDGERVRVLLREYRLSHPEGDNRLQAGYEVLAECLANPGNSARVEAARYYDAHRGSILRRSIRRVCLEG
jgi:hypothetical protein